ncbi:MAG: Na/Pi cotransporter family protein [Saprospiraceae bacterium]|jgi:phosphate:Na+ symporter
MEFGFTDFIQIIGSLAFFIFGMKLMSDGIQRAAGSQLRNILRTMTKNRYIGVITGFITTALVQSSSATTVMTVSFVNAGLLSLVESAGVMMGANIGTTITGWLVSFLGFKIKLHHLSIPLFALAVPMLFSNRGKFKYWGEFLVGFAILFLGLSYLKDAVPNIKGNPEVLEFLQNFTEWGFLSRLFFVLVGTVVTITVQSSSAAMAITLTMCAQGWLPFDVAAAMILGENIGTTITAELASLVGNVHAKRSARIHSMFNIIGVTWMVILMPFFLKYLSLFVQTVFDINDPYTSAADMPIALSAFHTAFNFTNVLLLIGFVPFLVKAAIWSVKSKGDEDEEFGLMFIKSGNRTPELATVELQKETVHFGEITSKMTKQLHALINTTKAKKQEKLYQKISKYEKITDDMEVAITEYITNISNEEITPKTSLRLRSLLNIANDLERIGDIFFQLSKVIEKKNQENVYLDIDQRENLNIMINYVGEAFAEMIEILKSPSYDKANIDKAYEIEEKINIWRDRLRDENQTKLGTDGYNINSAMVYNNVFYSLEKIGDHIINIAEAVKGEI